MKYLITVSLLNSWLWLINYQGDDDTKARNDFLTTLKRLPLPDNEYFIKGRKFEKDIQGYCNGNFETFEDSYYHSCVQEIANIVSGGIWQVKGYADININGIDYFLYGICDVLHGPIIYDIKMTTKYDNPLKYYNSAQHKMYFKCFPGVQRFVYLISDGKDVFNEIYQNFDTEPIDIIIADFQSWLNNHPEEQAIYQEKWKSKER